MNKEEAVERILIEVFGKISINEIDKHSNVRDKLTAILTELMEPITEEEIREWAALKTGNVITDCSENYYNGVIDGAKWAATRNLKVSLEGLKEYALFDFKRGGVFNYCLKSDVEKLVG